MLAIRIELLTGRYAATRFNDRNATEWPPHPARLFSALVATWADADEPDPAERSALTWLESLGAPEIAASASSSRNPVTFFVPNNEASATVVTDQSKNYAKLAELGMELAAAHAALALDPADRAAQKSADKAQKALAKLQDKIGTDSAKGSAAKASESVDGISNGIQLLPDERGKQGRTFPVAIPDDPVVVFSWPAADPTAEQRMILDQLLARVARLGHSSSMVSCTFTDEETAATLVPADDGTTMIRVTSTGLLDELELAYASHQASEPRVLPTVLASYRRPIEAAPAVPAPNLGDDWIVLTDTGADKLPLTRALDLTKAVRGALLSFAADPPPEVLSGHKRGEPGERTPSSETPHLAVVALPFVGRDHADGNIRGVALVLPREATPDDRAAVASAVREWADDSGTGVARVTLGPAGIRHLEIGDQISSTASLRPETWCRPAQRWVSATPVALDRFPGDLWSSNPHKHNLAEAAAIETIARACAHVGLPRPIHVDLFQSGPLVGVPDLRRFPAYRSPGRKVRRMSVHVRLLFGEPVAGPVLIGAGRYFGYGLLRPVRSQRSETDLAGGDGEGPIGRSDGRSDEVAS